MTPAMHNHRIRDLYEEVIQSFLAVSDAHRGPLHPVHLGARTAEQLDLQLHNHLKEETP